jgi:autophagy-related protein 9
MSDLQMRPLLQNDSDSPWARQPRLDAFFRLVYQYYQSKGFACMVVERLVDLLVTLFLVCLALFLFGGAIDYTALNHRVHQLECANHTENRATLFETDCFGTRPIDITRLRHMSWGWVPILLMVGLGWSLAALRFVQTLPEWIRVRRFYREVMAIPSEDMATISWTDVMQRLLAAQATHRMCVTLEHMDQLHVTNMITRRYNYYVALYTENILAPHITLPWWGPRAFLPTSMHWNIDRIISACVFDQDNNLSVEFRMATQATTVATINRMYRVLALANLLLAPLIILYRLVYFFFNLSGEWRKNASVLSTRQWSPLAQWKLREYCEADHHFRERLARSYKPACQYLGMFSQPLTSVFARMVSLFLGGMLVVLVLGGIVYDEDFFQVTLTPHRSVAWWVGMLGFVLAGTVTFITGDHVVFEPERKLREVAVHTHYYPEQWSAASPDTRRQFIQLFQYKLVIFVEEIMSVFINPYLLAFQLPQWTPAMVRFFHEQTTTCPGIGDVCSYSLFRNTLYDQPTSSTTNNLVRSSYMGQEDVPWQNKMEASYLNFQQTFPTWQHS